MRDGDARLWKVVILFREGEALLLWWSGLALSGLADAPTISILSHSPLHTHARMRVPHSFSAPAVQCARQVQDAFLRQEQGRFRDRGGGRFHPRQEGDLRDDVCKAERGRGLGAAAGEGLCKVHGGGEGWVWRGGEERGEDGEGKRREYGAIPRSRLFQRPPATHSLMCTLHPGS